MDLFSHLGILSSSQNDKNKKPLKKVFFSKPLHLKVFQREDHNLLCPNQAYYSTTVQPAIRFSTVHCSPHVQYFEILIPQDALLLLSELRSYCCPLSFRLYRPSFSLSGMPLSKVHYPLTGSFVYSILPFRFTWPIPLALGPCGWLPCQHLAALRPPTPAPLTPLLTHVHHRPRRSKLLFRAAWLGAGATRLSLLSLIRIVRTCVAPSRARRQGAAHKVVGAARSARPRPTHFDLPRAPGRARARLGALRPSISARLLARRPPREPMRDGGGPRRARRVTAAAVATDSFPLDSTCSSRAAVLPEHTAAPPETSPTGGPYAPGEYGILGGVGRECKAG